MTIETKVPPYDVFKHITASAVHALESASPPAQFTHPCDLFFTIKPHTGQKWYAWHIWFDPEERTTAATQIVWKRSFDHRRLYHPTISPRYSQRQTPTLEIFYHAPEYDDLRKGIDAILGAIPVDTSRFQRSNDPDHSWANFTLRLPLGELALDWVAGALSQCRRHLHEWLLTVPAIRGDKASS